MNSEEARAITLSDLAQLTLRANVAFAVRCAQRLRPCFQLPGDVLNSKEQLKAVDAAIQMAAAFCQGLPVETGGAAEAARLATIVTQQSFEFSRFAGYGAVRAALAAANAEDFVRNASDSSMIEVVASAFGAGRVLAAHADNFTQDAVVIVLYADVQKLVGLAHGTCEDLGQPVDPSESGPLGPLWPAGTPACFAPAGQHPSGVGG